MRADHGFRRIETGCVVSLVPVAPERAGILIAFSERTGGVSAAPCSSLNLAAHVGDDPVAVDENRTRLLRALGLEAQRARLTLSEQVHGEAIAVVSEADAGAGAFASAYEPPIAASDALLTDVPEVPLLMCFADCVPVVIAATRSRRAVAVVHAGWRGCLARLPGKAASALAEFASCPTRDLVACVGPHIGRDDYEVGCEILSQFASEFATMPSARGRLDLGAVVSESLRDVGIAPESQLHLGFSTTQDTDRFYSYRREGRTGRHGALAVILR